MNTLFVFSDTFQGYAGEFLDILGLIALFVGITVIIIKNPISSLICLMLLFASISIYLIGIGLNFIAFSYLIVYIGAVSILFLFILMLINIRTSELQSNNSNSIPLAIIIGGLLNYVLFEVLPYNIAAMNYLNDKMISIFDYLQDTYLLYYFLNKIIDTDSIYIMLVTSNSWDNNIAETSHISAIGNILYTSYNLWLFIASIILLLAMIGAIVITIKQQENNRKISSTVERLFYTQ